MDAFLGEIRPFAFNHAPVGWFKCNGQLLPIQQYTALFSVLGVTYGGNGTSTFALPNINDRLLNGAGQLTGGDNYPLGATGGSFTATINEAQVPEHTHTLNAAAPVISGTTAAAVPVNLPVQGSYLSNPASDAGPGKGYVTPTEAADSKFHIDAVSYDGSGGAHDNTMPYLSINYCICVTNGQYPVRA